MSDITRPFYGPRKQSRLSLMGIRFLDDEDNTGEGAGDITADADAAPVVDEAAAHAAALDSARAEATAAAQADIANIITQAVEAAVVAAVAAVKAEAFDALLLNGDDEVDTELGGEADSTAVLPDDSYDDEFASSPIGSLFTKEN